MSWSVLCATSHFDFILTRTIQDISRKQMFRKLRKNPIEVIMYGPAQLTFTLHKFLLKQIFRLPIIIAIHICEISTLKYGALPFWSTLLFPVGIYMFKVNNRNTRKRCETCTKVTKKNTRTTSVTLFWCLYSKLWTYFTPLSSVLIVDFEQANFSWEVSVKFCNAWKTSFPKDRR